MAAKISWYRYGTKLRHCHPVYSMSRTDLSPEQSGMEVGGGGDCEETVAGADDESVEQRDVEAQRRERVDDERGVAQLPDALGRCA